MPVKEKNKTKAAAQAYKFAKAHAVKEVFSQMEGLLKENGNEDPLYTLYTHADKMGFAVGTPVFQGGLPAVGFRGRTMKIIMDNGHTTFITMGQFLEILGKACIKTLEETHEARKPVRG